MSCRYGAARRAFKHLTSHTSRCGLQKRAHDGSEPLMCPAGSTALRQLA